MGRYAPNVDGQPRRRIDGDSRQSGCPDAYASRWDARKSAATDRQGVRDVAREVAHNCPARADGLSVQPTPKVRTDGAGRGAVGAPAAHRQDQAGASGGRPPAGLAACSQSHGSAMARRGNRAARRAARRAACRAGRQPGGQGCRKVLPHCAVHARAQTVRRRCPTMPPGPLLFSGG
jgi:hypothetical protein